MTALIKTYVTEKKYSSPCFDAAAAVKIVLIAEEVCKNRNLDMPLSGEMEKLIQSMNSKESVWFLAQLDLKEQFYFDLNNSISRHKPKA